MAFSSFNISSSIISSKILSILGPASDQSTSTNKFSATINKTLEFTAYNISSKISYEKLNITVYNNKGEIILYELKENKL